MPVLGNGVRATRPSGSGGEREIESTIVVARTNREGAEIDTIAPEPATSVVSKSVDHRADPSIAGVADGLIDFGAYSIEQLQELQPCLDRCAYPENYRRLIDALQQKASPRSAGLPPERMVPGRFTTRGGWLGWLTAKRIRSPVYGPGWIEVGSSNLVLSGLQRTWLGAGMTSQVLVEFSAVRNVACDGTYICFEIRRAYRYPARVRFECESTAQAEALVNQLPLTTTPRFAVRGQEAREFHQTLQTLGGRPLVTPALVAANFVAFVAMAVIAKSPGGFTVQQLWGWGANFGPLTVNEQWWRLLTSMFVHLNLAHVLLNMWALWNVGRLSERLFGRGSFLALYLATGLLAGIGSIAWDPSLTSAGASGAIFGIFGAFLAFLFRQRAELPRALLRSHWVSTVAFVLFNFVSGAWQPGIDNAAHVSGLLSGLFLGFLLARPLNPASRRRFPLRQAAAGAAFIVSVVGVGIWQVKGLGSTLTGPELYARSHGAFLAGEQSNLRLWADLAARANSGSISNTELAQRFELEILPFWKIQKDQLAKDSKTLSASQRQLGQLAAQFADLRFQWASALIEGANNNDQQRFKDAVTLMNETTVVQARLDRVNLRSRMEHRPRALASNPLVIRAREWLVGYHGECVVAPPPLQMPVSAADDQRDGPALRHALACEAQHLFMNGDYERLDALLNRSVATLEDLPDGSSRYEALIGGLSNLFDYGRLSVDSAFGHTADWRRQTNDSVMSELAEAMAFRAWAWAARGHDSANSVTNQNLATFGYRSELAAAALQDIASRAVHNPLWYSLSINVGLDQGHDAGQLRTLFDQGAREAPGYRPLYRAMLRALMPRWGGSYLDEDQFINAVDWDRVRVRGDEWYAELYSAYADLEGDDVDLFQATEINWRRMRVGYGALIRRYPSSDWMLNRFANFACRAADRDEYQRLRRSVGVRYAASAWSQKVSLASCDGKFKLPVAAGTNDKAGFEPAIHYESFGGIRLGQTRQQLQAIKGPPLRQDAKSWAYNSVDSKHDGVLTVYFAPPNEDPQEKIRAIEYSGDQTSAPADLPYLIDESSVQIIQRYGEQVSGQLVLTGPMTFSFSNGLYVMTRDEKVDAYGIYLPK